MRRVWTYCYCKCPSNTYRILLNHHVVSTTAECRCIFLHSSGHTRPSVTHDAISCTCDKSTKLAIIPPGVPQTPKVLFNKVTAQPVDYLIVFTLLQVQIFAFLLADLHETSVSIVLKFLRVPLVCNSPVQCINPWLLRSIKYCTHL